MLFWYTNFHENFFFSSFLELLGLSGSRRKLWCTWLRWRPLGAFKSNTVGKQLLHDHRQSVVPSTEAGLGVWCCRNDRKIRKTLTSQKVSFRRLAVGAPPALPHWQRAFGKLPLATVLNVTQWDSFESRANEVLPTSCALEGMWHFEMWINPLQVMSLFQLVESNATDAGSLVCQIFESNPTGQACARL